jgi:hypothetical protein
MSPRSVARYLVVAHISINAHRLTASRSRVYDDVERKGRRHVLDYGSEELLCSISRG